MSSVPWGTNWIKLESNILVAQNDVNLHLGSLWNSGWCGIFHLFASWCNPGIFVPRSWPLLTALLRNQTDDPESPLHIFSHWKFHLCVLRQRKCLAMRHRFLHPLMLLWFLQNLCTSALKTNNYQNNYHNNNYRQFKDPTIITAQVN